MQPMLQLQLLSAVNRTQCEHGVFSMRLQPLCCCLYMDKLWLWNRHKQQQAISNSSSTAYSSSFLRMHLSATFFALEMLNLLAAG